MKLDDLFTSSWSPKVKEYALGLINSIQEFETYEDEPFFENEETYNIFFDLVCEASTQLMLEEGEVVLDEETFMRLSHQAQVMESLLSLKEKGEIDWIENEDGEEIIFRKNHHS
jgi:hypothetical protein